MFTGVPSSWSLEMQAGCWVLGAAGERSGASVESPGDAEEKWSSLPRLPAQGALLTPPSYTAASGPCVLVNLPEFKILAPHFAIFWPILGLLLWRVPAKSQEVPWIRSAGGQDPST